MNPIFATILLGNTVVFILLIGAVGAIAVARRHLVG